MYGQLLLATKSWYVQGYITFVFMRQLTLKLKVGLTLLTFVQNPVIPTYTKLNRFLPNTFCLIKTHLLSTTIQHILYAINMLRLRSLYYDL